MNKDLSQLLTYPSELMGNENGMPTSDDQQRALGQASEVDNAIAPRLNIKFPTEEGAYGRALPPFASFRSSITLQIPSFLLSILHCFKINWGWMPNLLEECRLRGWRV